MMQSPIVSILIPVFNTADYLEECLDSILGQSYKNIHIIIVNDGSTDNSHEICERYASRNTRIDYHCVEHVGIAGVRNTLLERATGDYSIFIDSDDWIDSDMIDYMVKTIQQHDLDLLVIGRHGQQYNKAIVFENELMICDKECAVQLFLKERALTSSLWAKLVKTEIIKAQRFDSDILYGEDVMMTWKLINQIKKLGISEVRLYHYQNNQNSITNQGFNDATYSLHYVWDRIVIECDKTWTKYTYWAKRQKIETYSWLLYTAIRSNIHKDHRIVEIKNYIKSEISEAVYDRRFSIKFRLLTLCSTNFYNITRLLLYPFRKNMPILQ